MKELRGLRPLRGPRGPGGAGAPGRTGSSTKGATHHLKKTLAGGKWEVVRGSHVFRHAFASSPAAAGARQEVIDKMMGHQSEEMRRRYRHLWVSPAFWRTRGAAQSTPFCGSS